MAPFLGRGLSPYQTKVPWAEAYLHTKWHLDASSHLATIEMGRKLGGGLRPLFGEGAESPSNTKSPGPRSVSITNGIMIHAAIWPQQILAENWGFCAFGVGGAVSPSNTVWPGPRPTCMPSFILFHPTVWPEYTNVTDRTGQRSDSIVRSVLQIVAPKWYGHVFRKDENDCVK